MYAFFSYAVFGSYKSCLWIRVIGTHTWWRHQRETFSALLAICAGNSPVTGEFPSQRPMAESVDVFFFTWTNGWVNNQECDNMRHHCIHYDVTVIILAWCQWPIGITWLIQQQSINAFPPSDAYMRQLTASPLVRVMDWCLFGAKPLPKPMLTYCPLEPYGQTSVKFDLKHNNFHSRKCISKCRLQCRGPLFRGRRMNR